MPTAAREVDQACAALVTDLDQRGMLDDTLVLWGGEFGRTPMGQGTGRDHHILGFSLWMAGGGIKGGITYGATDELGYKAVENVVHVRDLHATILHLCGIDHARLILQVPGARRAADRRRAGAGGQGVAGLRLGNPQQYRYDHPTGNSPMVGFESATENPHGKRIVNLPASLPRTHRAQAAKAL